MPVAGNRYQQVMETLRARIEGGAYQVGDRLPAETELAASLGVSRPTLRQALAQLESEGLVSRVKGSGTCVAAPKLLHESTSFLAGYRQEAERHHRTLRTQVLSLEVQRAGSLGEKLSLPSSAQITRLARRRWVDGLREGRPVVYTVVHVPYALFPDMAQQDFTTASFYELLEARGLKVCHASRVLEVVVPPPQVAKALELSPFEPAIYVDSVGFDARGRRVEYAQSYYPAGSSRFLIEVER